MLATALRPMVHPPAYPHRGGRDLGESRSMSAKRRKKHLPLDVLYGQIGAAIKGRAGKSNKSLDRIQSAALSIARLYLPVPHDLEDVAPRIIPDDGYGFGALTAAVR